MSFERRKSRVGTVVSDKMDQTVVVAVEWRMPHALYKKPVKRRTRFKAHDSENQCQIGDVVRIRETRPLSKTKRWRVSDILVRKDIADIQPEEIVIDDLAAETDLVEEMPEPRDELETSVDEVDEIGVAVAAEAVTAELDEAGAEAAEEEAVAELDEAGAEVAEEEPVPELEEAESDTAEEEPVAESEETESEPAEEAATSEPEQEQAEEERSSE